MSEKPCRAGIVSRRAALLMLALCACTEPADSETESASATESEESSSATESAIETKPETESETRDGIRDGIRNGQQGRCGEVSEIIKRRSRDLLFILRRSSLQPFKGAEGYK